MIPLDDNHEPDTKAARIAGLALVILAAAAGFWWIESSRPSNALERAGGPAPHDPTRTMSGAGPGASPFSSSNAALVVPSSPVSRPENHEPYLSAVGLDRGAKTTDDPARHRAFRSPLEQSPGYVPPADPESMSVITGRREHAPLVPGEFAGGAGSAEALAQLALDAFQNTNEMQLHELRVTQSEFARFLWREFPQSRPITNIQSRDAWDMIATSSLAGAGKAYSVYAGRKLDVLGIEGREIEYRNFNLWRDVVIRARDTQTGEELRLDFLPTIAERHGRFKVFSYKD